MLPDSTRQQKLDEKRRFWSAHISTWKLSRLSQIEYCRRHELKFHQFVYWRRKFCRKPAAPLSLVQVPATAVAQVSGYRLQPAALRLALAADLSIEVGPGFDPATLRELVTVLRGLR
jgi:hypothetical protein